MQCNHKAISETLKQVHFDADGLVPVVAQDHRTHAVLMVAWMTAEALEQTLSTGRMVYWSRSKQALWRKGDTSGHTQHLVSMAIDCDGDTLLAQVEQVGPACHTGSTSCFFNTIEKDGVVSGKS